jgi:hypothetical protein
MNARRSAHPGSWATSGLRGQRAKFRPAGARLGFADPDWLVSISVSLTLGLLLLPWVRRDGEINWICAVAVVILVLPFWLLVVCGIYQRLRSILRASLGRAPRDHDRQEKSR